MAIDIVEIEGIQMISLKDAMTKEGVSRQLIQKEINRGNIPGARFVFNTLWAIPYAWEYEPRPLGRPPEPIKEEGDS